MPYLLIAIGVLLIVIGIYLLTRSGSESESEKQKGDAFENYMIQKIGKIPGAIFVSKNSDYHQNGVSAAENRDPDLKFKIGQELIAIECKYRSSFSASGKIEWAKEYQLNNYRSFEKEKNHSVFIAIGVGGSPALPKKLYIVPLFRLTKTFAVQSYIEEFEINPSKQLVFNSKKMKFE